jgi:murein L,D-transpeptidase YafK
MTRKYVIAACVILAVAGIAIFSIRSQPIPAGAKATSIMVEKNKHLMIVYSNGDVLRVYHVSLGRGHISAKQREGDNRTPEGRYIIDSKNAHSTFYKSLHISYPSAQDIAHARLQGVPPGGAVMIHGLRNDLKWLGSLHRLRDWTKGCIAITDAEMDELWPLVDAGTPIEIKP